MGQLFEAVIDFLAEDDWKFVVVREETAAVLNYRGHHGSWQCFVNVDEDRQWFSFFSILPASVPEDKRLDVAEFITRANYGLVIGNFEMDFNDGEVRFKVSVDVEGGDLTSKMIENVLGANLTTMDRYFAGFMAVIYGDLEPSEAIADIEGGGEDAGGEDDGGEDDDGGHDHGDDEDDEDDDIPAFDELDDDAGGDGTEPPESGPRPGQPGPFGASPN